MKDYLLFIHSFSDNIKTEIMEASAFFAMILNVVNSYWKIP